MTLDKSEAEYSPTTMYQDYAISPRALPLGVAVRNHGRLADRSAVPEPPGRGHSCSAVHQTAESLGVWHRAPYLFLGEADYAEHRGERPIAITWRLRTPMPAADFATASVVV